jgi:hypothetical protein
MIEMSLVIEDGDVTLCLLGSRYRSGHSPDWLKMKNPDAPAVKREVEEGRWRRSQRVGEGNRRNEKKHHKARGA